MEPMLDLNYEPLFDEENEGVPDTCLLIKIINTILILINI
jgi:hypothetical protein